MHKSQSFPQVRSSQQPWASHSQPKWPHKVAVRLQRGFDLHRGRIGYEILIRCGAVLLLVLRVQVRDHVILFGYICVPWCFYLYFYYVDTLSFLDIMGNTKETNGIWTIKAVNVEKYAIKDTEIDLKLHQLTCKLLLKNVEGLLV